VIILDTNVISEPLRLKPNPAVVAWLDEQSAETLYTTATSLSELWVGIEALPKGKRKAGLKAALTELLPVLFGDRILPFDTAAAMRYAELVVRAQAKGHAISVGDGQIAAIAAVHGYRVATRDTAPFLAARVAVVNPWALS
jgi:predicted nucleic acid-binding protein